jgi:hypothetical protein
MNRSLKLVLLICALGGLWQFSQRPPREVQRPPGVFVTETPAQTPLAPSDAPFAHGRFRIEPVARYRIRARLLSREDYRFDAGAELSPLDFAVGWAGMSDTAVIEQLSVSQSVRFFSYRWRDQPPLPLDEINRSSANMHLIPADDAVLKALRQVAVGRVVELEGWLVNADREDGWRWRSSTTREDWGAGACELMYVREVRLIE